MPLVVPAIEKKLSAELQVELANAFGGGADAASGPASHKKLADAIAAAVAKVIINELLTSAVVTTSMGPGKIT